MHELREVHGHQRHQDRIGASLEGDLPIASSRPVQRIVHLAAGGRRP